MSKSITTIKSNVARSEAIEIINRVFPNVSHYEIYDLGLIIMLQKAKAMSDLSPEVQNAIKIASGSNRWN